jgi:hypothetical protein
MAISSRTIRGLQDIRTHSGRVREAIIPHKAFMRLSCLEMEKFRRAKERESAITRVRNIDSRFRDIDAEKTVILNAMNKLNNDSPVGERNEEHKSEPHRKSGAGFKLKY